MIKLKSLLSERVLLCEADLKDFAKYISKTPQERAAELEQFMRQDTSASSSAVRYALQKSGLWEKVRIDLNQWRGIEGNQARREMEFFKEYNLFEKYPQLKPLTDEWVREKANPERFTDDYLDKNYSKMNGLLDRGNDTDKYNDVSWAYFRFIRELPNGWLIHFSKTAENIFNKDEFENLVTDPRRLGFTAAGARKMIRNSPGRGKDGYGFAYTADFMKQHNRLYVSRMSDNEGRDAVMFRAPGVLAYHRIDEEEEVVFCGKDVRDMVFIKNYDEKKFIVETNGGTTAYKTTEIKDAIEWVEKNFNQFKDKLTNPQPHDEETPEEAPPEPI